MQRDGVTESLWQFHTGSADVQGQDGVQLLDPGGRMGGIVTAVHLQLFVPVPEPYIICIRRQPMCQIELVQEVQVQGAVRPAAVLRAHCRHHRISIPVRILQITGAGIMCHAGRDKTGGDEAQRCFRGQEIIDARFEVVVPAAVRQVGAGRRRPGASCHLRLYSCA